MTRKNTYSKIVCLLALLMTCTAAQAQTFPYPDIPQELKNPKERGTYLLAHYWDGFDFNDTTLIHKPELAEQGFANFIDLLPRFGSTVAEQGVGAFAQRAFRTTVPKNVRNHFATLIERYLQNPNSPLRSDELYIMFLKRMVASPIFTQTERGRFAYQLKNAQKNLPGTVAADFKYATRSGKASTLHKTKGKLLLLIFYDPACTHCTDILNGLRTDTLLCRLIKERRLSVLAIYTEGDRPLWNATKTDLPVEWAVGIDESDIVENGIYDIPAMPTLYLLDKNKRVILKDPTPQALTNYLSTTGL